MNTTGRYAFAGYAADVLQIASFRFSNPHSLMKILADRCIEEANRREAVHGGRYLPWPYGGALRTRLRKSLHD
jgi:hypothetical protein